jgi:hypothetical protein
MKIPLRRFIEILCAAIVAPFAHAAVAKAEPKVIRATDPGAGSLEVYNAETGEVHHLVHTITVGQWIEQYVDEGPSTVTKPLVLLKLQLDVYGNPVVRRVDGNFQVRPKVTQDWHVELQNTITSRRNDPSAIRAIPFPLDVQAK